MLGTVLRADGWRESYPGWRRGREWLQLAPIRGGVWALWYRSGPGRQLVRAAGPLEKLLGALRHTDPVLD